MKQIPMTVLSLLLWFANADEGLAGETCQIVTHAKLSLADFADGPADTDHFYFSDVDFLHARASLLLRIDILRSSSKNFATCTFVRVLEMILACARAAMIGLSEKLGSTRLLALLSRWNAKPLVA